jgi:hypothetical protein
VHVPRRADDSLDRFTEDDLYSTDEDVRAKALRRLCPCHGSFEMYDKYLDVIRAMQKDPSDKVRRVALHLEEDALLLESMQYRREETEEALSRRRR